MNESKPIDILRRVKVRIENGEENTVIWGKEFNAWDKGAGPAWDFVRRVGGHSGGWTRDEAMIIITEAIALAEANP
jgi:hypothetical protein